MSEPILRQGNVGGSGVLQMEHEAGIMEARKTIWGEDVVKKKNIEMWVGTEAKLALAIAAAVYQKASYPPPKKKQ